MAKKKKTNEESTKLDMSFEDAMQLALNTPPIMTVELKLKEERELRPPAGRILRFISLDVNQGESAKQLILTVIVKKNNGEELKKPFTPQEYENNTTKGLFGENALSTNNTEITVCLSSKDSSSTLPSCLLTYTLEIEPYSQ